MATFCMLPCSLQTSNYFTVVNYCRKLLITLTPALLYRFEYIRNMCEFRDVKASLSTMLTSLASLYATIVVCVYVAFATTELVTYPEFKVWLRFFAPTLAIVLFA
jgi:hypothetical protein